jgi:hypothetical protein
VASISSIINCVSNMTLIPVEVFLNDNRLKYIARARFAICALAYEQGFSYAQIGRTLNGRDHTSIMHAVTRSKSLEENDVGFRLLITTARREIANADKILLAPKVVTPVPQSEKPREPTPWVRDERRSVKDHKTGSSMLARAINQARSN